MSALKTILATATSFVSTLGLRPIWSTKNTEGQPATLGKEAEEILNSNFSVLETEVAKKADETNASGKVVRTADGTIPVIDLSPYAKTTTPDGTVVRTPDGTINIKGVSIIQAGETIINDGEYLMIDDGTVNYPINGGTSTIQDIPVSLVNTNGYIHSDGSFLAGDGNYRRSALMTIPVGATQFEVYSMLETSAARPIAFYTDAGTLVSIPSFNTGYNTPLTVQRPTNATKYALCRNINYNYKCIITIAPYVSITNNNAISLITKSGNKA